jgi:hypothetical protein
LAEDKQKLIIEEQLYAEPLHNENFLRIRGDLKKVLQGIPNVNKNQPITASDYFYVC